MANGAFAPKNKCLIFHSIFNLLLSKELTAYFWHYSTFNEKSWRWDYSQSIFFIFFFQILCKNVKYHRANYRAQEPILSGLYEGWSKSSDRCLVALSRDIFERHTMHHSKDLVFIFIMMLIFSGYTVAIDNYSTLYMVHSIPQAFFSYYRIMIVFISEFFKPSIFKTTK